MDFKVNISPVSDADDQMKYLLYKLLYLNETNFVDDLLKNGGTAQKNLDQETAETFVQKLREMGITAEALKENENSPQNNLPSGFFIGADEHKRQISLKTPGGHKLTLSDFDNSFTMEDIYGNKITMSAEGITISSIKNLHLTAAGGLKLEGAAGVEISSSAITAIKGSLIQIN